MMKSDSLTDALQLHFQLAALSSFSCMDEYSLSFSSSSNSPEEEECLLLCEKKEECLLEEVSQTNDIVSVTYLTLRVFLLHNLNLDRL